MSRAVQVAGAISPGPRRSYTQYDFYVVIVKR